MSKQKYEHLRESDLITGEITFQWSHYHSGDTFDQHYMLLLTVDHIYNIIAAHYYFNAITSIIIIILKHPTLIINPRIESVVSYKETFISWLNRLYLQGDIYISIQKSLEMSLFEGYL